jgi:opacity protein-like surface antigen
MKRFFLFLLIIAAGITNVSAYQSKVDYWILQARGGIGYPIFDSGDNLNLGFSGGISARKGFDAEFSGGGGIALINMPYKITGAPGNFSATIIQLEGVYAPYVPDFIIWPYLKVALGMWMVKYANLTTGASPSPQLSSETTFGFQLGGGASYPINNQFSLNVEALFNQASIGGGTGDSYNFITFCAGVSMFLK